MASVALEESKQAQGFPNLESYCDLFLSTLAGIQLRPGYQMIVEAGSNHCRDSDETASVSSREVSEHRLSALEDVMSKTASGRITYVIKEKDKNIPGRGYMLPASVIEGLEWFKKKNLIDN